jgi:putative addiction module component (TIGR02574 family)
MRYAHGRIGRTGVIMNTAGASSYCSIVEQYSTCSVVVKKSFPNFPMGESRPSSPAGIYTEGCGKRGFPSSLLTIFLSSSFVMEAAYMSEQGRRILEQAMKLSSTERAEVLEQILASFSIPAKKDVDERWTEEAEDRLDAYERGDLKSSPRNEVFVRIDRGEI